MRAALSRGWTPKASALVRELGVGSPRRRASGLGLDLARSLDLGLGLAVFFGFCTLACGVPRTRPWIHPTSTQWRSAKAVLSRLRASAPTQPYAASVTTTMREPRTGRVFEGRGAIAIAPGEAVRMIVVGGAGATLLDIWVTPHRFRMAIPPLQIVRRGGSEEPLDLPVGFLRWWLLEPLQGALFAAETDPARILFLLRHNDAVIELALGRQGSREQLVATRRAGGHAERVEEAGANPALGAGDRVRYIDESSGLEVNVTVEAISAGPPDAAAFLDPDGQGGGS